MTIALTTKNPNTEKQNARPYRWNVAAYYQAFEAGCFTATPHVELIEGEIIEHVSPHSPPHTAGILRCSYVLQGIAAPRERLVLTQVPLNAGEYNEPEPDVMVVRGHIEDYDDRHPRPDEVELLIEVSVSTLNYDRRRKSAIYAAVSVPEYWLLDVAGRMLEVRRDPVADTRSATGWRYRTLKNYDETQTVTPLLFPGTAVRVADLLPRVPPTAIP
jgi:Uma2 family endonuclease